MAIKRPPFAEDVNLEKMKPYKLKITWYSICMKKGFMAEPKLFKHKKKLYEHP